MDGPGNEFFSRTAFAWNQYIGFGGADLQDPIIDGLHAGGIANDPVKMNMIF